MRKQLRKALSMVLSAAMVVALGSGVDYKAAGAAADAEDSVSYKATVNVQSTTGSYRADQKEIDITGNGEYTVEVSKTTTQETDEIDFLYVDITDAVGIVASGASATITGGALTVDGDVKAITDATAVAVEAKGEGTQDARVKFMNPWGTSAFGKFTYTDKVVLKFTINVPGWPEKKTENPEDTTAPSTEPSPTATGGGTVEKHDVNFDATLNFQDANGTWNWDSVDLKITGNGEYTVKMDANAHHNGDAPMQGCPVTNAWLQITDGVEMVEQEGSTVTVSSLTVDGEEIGILSENADIGYPDGNEESPDGRATFMNPWGTNIFEDFEMGDEAELTFTINVPTWTDKKAEPEPIEFEEPTTAQLRYGWDVSRDNEGVEVADAEVTGEGQYKVGIDLRKAVSTDGTCVDVQILDVEENYPDWLIRVDEVRVNGVAVDAELLKKTYTCNDGDTTTAVLYNQYKPADEPTKGEHNERALVELSEVSPQALQSCFRDEDGEGLEIKMVEVAFTYGTKDYVEAKTPYALGESLFAEEGPEGSATPTPSATATAKPGTTNTPAPKATATVAPTQKPGSTTPTSAPKGTTVKDNNGSYKVTAAGAVEYAPSAAAKKKSTVKVPDTVKVNGVTYKVTSIKKKAFAKNKKLTKLTIGNNIKTIGDEAFSTCSKLKSVTFGKSVKKIGKKAFFKCKKLKTAKFLGSGAVTVGKQAFKGTPKKMKVNVKKMKKKNYKKTTKALKKGGMKSPKFTPKKAPKK